MLVIMRNNSTVEQCAAVEDAIRAKGYEPLPVPGENRTAICVTGNKGAVEAGAFMRLPGVLECISVTRPYKLVSREVRDEPTIVKIGDVAIGGDDPVLIAGPCSVETQARTLAIAQGVKASGAQVFRAGAFKPRTNPYSFQGLGREALHTLKMVREETGLPIVSEVLDSESAEMMGEFVDALQVGTRNMQNFSLLKKLSTMRIPVLLKRGMSATFQEWMMAAEYLLAAGNDQVILCERGIRGFDRHSRNTLDLNIVPLVRSSSHLPIIVDPSHGVGDRDRVRAMARASMACGAHGLMIESHTDPASSYTDADQTVSVETLDGIHRDMNALSKLEAI